MCIRDRLRTARHATDRNDPIIVIPTRDSRARRARGMQQCGPADALIAGVGRVPIATIVAEGFKLMEEPNGAELLATARECAEATHLPMGSSGRRGRDMREGADDALRDGLPIGVRTGVRVLISRTGLSTTTSRSTEGGLRLPV
eukprot:15451741-Alexandrium_andersonii.AAC.1